MPSLLILSRQGPGGSFQPPPESGLAPSHNDWADGVTVNPLVHVHSGC